LNPLRSQALRFFWVWLICMARYGLKLSLASGLNLQSFLPCPVLLQNSQVDLSLSSSRLCRFAE
jgi:hypothetical protein